MKRHVAVSERHCRLQADLGASIFEIASLEHGLFSRLAAAELLGAFRLIW